MAGFAVIMTFLLFGAVGVAGASIASFCLYFYARNRVRRAGRHPGIVAPTTVTPFLAFLWLIASFILHVLVSNILSRQDCGFGLSPDPWVTLPNGYVLGSHNTYDGYIAAPHVKTEQPVVGNGYVRSIIKLQWKDPYFIGTQFDFNSSEARAFVYDTRTRTAAISPSNINLNDYAANGATDLDAWTVAQTQTHFDADSYWLMYARNRHQWPNFVFLAVVLAGEAAIGFWLWRKSTLPSAEAVESSP
jgi:hypothetical protein